MLDHSHGFPQLLLKTTAVSDSTVCVFIFPDACVIRRGVLWLRGCRGLEDWPLLLQTRPRGSHCHGNGELHNRAERGMWEGRTCPILCQCTPECLFCLIVGAALSPVAFAPEMRKENRKWTTWLSDGEADNVHISWWKTVGEKSWLNSAGMCSVDTFSYQTAAGTQRDDWLSSRCLSGLSLLITVFGLSYDKIMLWGFEQT